MKNFIILFYLLFSSIVYSQIVDIPDINFKNALIEQGVDKNGDGEIQENEALYTSYLGIYGKNITSLVGIKSFKNLIHLNCSFNLLSSLDLSGMNAIQELDCAGNQLTHLNLKGNLNLKSLDGDFNYLTKIDLNGLTNLTTVRLIINNLEDINLKGLENLETLLCNNNLLTNLNIQDLKNLKSLQCGDNKIALLDIKNLHNLEELGCYNNLLTNLDISGLTKIFALQCQNNQLISLNIKNGTKILDWVLLDFHGNPNLQYICCDDFIVGEIREKIKTKDYNLKNCTVNTYCSFTPGGIFYSIRGESRLDAENNGCGIGDLPITDLKINITNGLDSAYFLTEPSGLYDFPVQDGTHSLTPLPEHPEYFNVNPMSFEVTFPDAGDTVIQNICIAPKGVHHDVQVSILPIEPARPGFDAKYKIIFTNRGTQVESGTINFIWNDKVLDFLSSDLPPDLQSKNLLSWNFSDLQPFESRNLNFVLNVNSPIENPSVNIGDILSFEANIITNNFDETPIDNVFDMRQTVVGSLDPNDKTCIEGKNIKPEMIGQYLHYLIRFENTGTYAAKNIVVKDLIDVNVFDIKSLQIIDASHKMFTRIKDNIVEFIFEDIELPFDDNNNDGYVSFKIKTRPNLILGDSLKNKAEIYFDYNLPIVTNEAVSLINNSVNTSELKANNIGFFPNPVKDVVQFLVNDQIETAQIFDLYGKILRSTSINNNQLNIQEFQNGTYMIRLFTGQKIYVAKVVKM